MHIAIDHLIRYRYDEPAAGVIQILRLWPRQADCQQIQDWRIDVDADGCLSRFTDEHGNFCHSFYAERPVDEISVRVSGSVWTFDTAGIVSGVDEPLPPILYRRHTPLTLVTPAVAAFADGLKGGGTLADGHALMMAIHERLAFEPGVTDIVSDADATLRLGRGVCQDLAHLFIAAARHMGHPARFVSGHLADAEQPEHEAAHAWAEMHVPGLGWVSFDPALGLCATAGHVRVAVGLDAREAAPVRGSRRSGGFEYLSIEIKGRDAAGLRSASGQSQSQ